MVFKDYYKILGLETNKVNIEEIRNAFRERAKQYHPDVNDTHFAEDRFKDINEAYRILSDTRSRRKYDRIWYSHVGRKIDKKKSQEEREARPDLLTLLFGTIRENKVKRQNEKAPQKGENIETEITINIEQAFYGINKSISLRAQDGKMKTFSIKIPAGIRNGEKLRLIAQGKQGINGGKNGDLLIKINIENTKQYRLHGIDIYTNLYITPSEAALGTKTSLQAIDDTVNIHIPKGISSGEKIRISQKGYKDGKGSRGDLIVELLIAVPKELSKEEEELYKKLEDVAKDKIKEENLA